MRAILPLLAAACGIPEVAADVHVRFDDVSAEAGLDRLGPNWLGEAPCLREALAGGAAVGDVDGDGDLDVFLPRLYLSSQLILNDGHGHFVLSDGLPELRGAANGALFVDVDGDRDLDLVVTPIGPEAVRLFVNDGNGTFVEEGVQRGMPDYGDVCADLFGVSAADVDGDGDLDLLVASWRETDLGHSDHTRLLHNDGTGHFVDGTAASGLDVLGAKAAFGGLFADRDGDGDPDLHLVADWGGTGLYRNDGGTFVATDQPFTDENGMGGDLGDANGDGRLDWFVSSVWQESAAQQCPPAWGCSGNRLYVDDGAGGFVDGTDAAGVREGQWGWGAAFMDYDLDGTLDLSMTGGMSVTGFEDEPGRLWRGVGAGRFADVTVVAGFDQRRQGRGLVPFDADGDGDLDVLVTGSLEVPSLWRNTGAEGRSWLSVSLDQPGANRFGIGAVVAVGAQVRLVSANPLYVSGPPPLAHFGLGMAPGPIDVEVTWPDGKHTRFDAVMPGSVVLTRP